jgi:hypothetical protein
MNVFVCQESTAEDEEDENDGMEELLASVSAAQAAPPGVLPTEIRKLVESRRLVKSLLAKGNLPAEEKMQVMSCDLLLKNQFLVNEANTRKKKKSCFWYDVKSLCYFS